MSHSPFRARSVFPEAGTCDQEAEPWKTVKLVTLSGSVETDPPATSDTRVELMTKGGVQGLRTVGEQSPGLDKDGPLVSMKLSPLCDCLAKRKIVPSQAVVHRSGYANAPPARTTGAGAQSRLWHARFLRVAREGTGRQAFVHCVNSVKAIARLQKPAGSEERLAGFDDTPFHTKNDLLVIKSNI